MLWAPVCDAVLPRGPCHSPLCSCGVSVPAPWRLLVAPPHSTLGSGLQQQGCCCSVQASGAQVALAETLNTLKRKSELLPVM